MGLLIMSFAYYMNLECVSLNLVDSHLAKMTDDNSSDVEFDLGVDLLKFSNNLSNGFIVLTYLKCYFECFLNSIVQAYGDIYFNIESTDSVFKKVTKIFKTLKKENNLKKLKKKQCWKSFEIVSKARNTLIHFDNNYIATCGDIPTFEVCEISAAQFFVKSNLEMLYKDCLLLTDEVAKLLCLKINYNNNIIDFEQFVELK